MVGPADAASRGLLLKMLQAAPDASTLANDVAAAYRVWLATQGLRNVEHLIAPLANALVAAILERLKIGRCIDLSGVEELWTMESILLRRPPLELRPVHSLGIEVAWGCLLDAIRRLDVEVYEAEVISSATRAALLDVDAEISQSLARRRAEPSGNQGSTHTQGGLQALLEEDLGPDNRNVVALPPRAKLLVAVVFGEPQDRSRSLMRISESIERDVATPIPPLRTLLNEACVMVIPLGDDSRKRVIEAGRRALDARRGRVVIGLGGIYRDLGGIHQSYVEAMKVVGLLVDAPQLPPVMSYEEALPYLLLKSNPQLTLDLLRSFIYPLSAFDPGDHLGLLSTLEAYVAAGGNVAKTAERLPAHRHTVSRRLRRIERITGTRLDEPTTLVRAHLSLLAARLPAVRR